MTSSNQETGWKRTLLELLWVVVRLVAVALMMATAMTLFARHHWLSDLLANLRMQQCLGLLVLFVLLTAFRRWTWLVATIVCLAIHLPWLLSGFSARAETKPNAERLTITLANVMTHNPRHEEIIADMVSRDPDVIAILELDTPLAARLDSQIGATYRHSIVRPMDDGNFGIGLYSRHPIEESEVFPLSPAIESISAKIRIESRAYRIFVGHPVPPIGNRGYQLRNDCLQKLATMIRATSAQAAEPTVLVGDLNLTPWSPHFRAFQRESGLQRASDGFDVTPTWYRLPAFPFGLVLDHAMISETMVCTAHVVGPDIGSDHRSITVTLTNAGETPRDP